MNSSIKQPGEAPSANGEWRQRHARSFQDSSNRSARIGAPPPKVYSSERLANGGAREISVDRNCVRVLVFSSERVFGGGFQFYRGAQLDTLGAALELAESTARTLRCAGVVRLRSNAKIEVAGCFGKICLRWSLPDSRKGRSTIIVGRELVALRAAYADVHARSLLRGAA